MDRVARVSGARLQGLPAGRGEGRGPRAIAVGTVVVEALAGLATDQARGPAARRQRRRSEPRLLVELVVDRLHDRVRDIEASQVQQFEGAEPETAATEADLFSQDPVHGFESRDAFANHGERFGAIAATGVVDQETGHVGGADHAVAGLANQCRQSLADDLVGPGTGDDLGDLHQRHRVEEVQAGDPARRPTAGGNVGDRQRRGVGREDGPGADQIFKRGEQGALDVEPLDDRLDDHVAVLQAFKGRDMAQAGHRPRPAIVIEAALGDLT